jgi:hypothetical protein
MQEYAETFEKRIFVLGQKFFGKDFEEFMRIFQHNKPIRKMSFINKQSTAQAESN